MTKEKFDSLLDREKWIQGKSLDVIWCCFNCLEQVDDGKFPNRCLFDGESMHCGNCDSMLTRRTPGGQCDPFNFTFLQFTFES